MRVSTMVRWCTALTMVILAAACSDTATAPTPAARPRLTFGSYEQWEAEFKRTGNALGGGSG